MSLDPYAPPAPHVQAYRAVPPTGFGGDLRGHKPWFAWIFLGCFVLTLFLLVGGIAAAVSSDGVADPDLRDTLAALGGLSIFAALMLFTVKSVLGLVWLHGAWSWLPWEQRVTRSGKTVSPSTAVGYMFIPYFNLYWMFVANVGLCDALDRVRVGFRGVGPAPRGMALGGCICQCIPLANVLVAPLFWFLYMRGVDRVHAQAMTELASVQAAGGYAAY